VSIVVLPSNRPAARFYRGGRRITELRGEAPASDFEPEDWIGSVTSVAGEAPVGQTVLDDGTLLSDAIGADPEYWLGSAHVRSFGADPMLLTKMLDAGQRLPVHAHPDRPWAASHLAATHGKTEAWYVLTPSEVWLGLVHDLSRAELGGMASRQDVGTLLAAMHRVEVGRGDVVHVPAGILHAIGEGILLVELQEPEDLSILVEWRGFAVDGPAKGHLGVGFDTALTAVEVRARGADELEGLVHRAGGGGPLLPAEASPFFRMERVELDGSATIDPGFAVAIVLSGDVTLTGARSDAAAALTRGSTVLLPHAVGEVALRGTAEILVCRPPLPR
jgi:mannose-6-phosphate isomerase